MGISGEGVIVDESLSLVETLCLFVRADEQEAEFCNSALLFSAVSLQSSDSR